MLPRVPVRLRGVAPDFVVPARYTLLMLGLIGNWIPDFETPAQDEDCLVYAAHAPKASRHWIPASDLAQRVLTRRNPISFSSRKSVGEERLDLFPVDTPTPSWASDPIAEAFFFLSLHEEWSDPRRDLFDRFDAGHSLLGSWNLLERPVVSILAYDLAARLQGAGFPISERKRFRGASSALCVTHDIDYLHKWTPGLAYHEVVTRLLRARHGGSLVERWTRFREYVEFLHPSKDPYKRSFLRFLDKERDLGIAATWFFKAGGRDKRDVSYSLRYPWLRERFRDLITENHEVGLHPSFHAHRDLGMLGSELYALETVIGHHPRAVRQHYLRFVYPHTWRHQVEMGLRVDSTLGFPMHEGFRNGVAHPFLPFDLDRGEPLPMWEIPLMAMDGTFSSYRGMSAAEARQAMLSLLKTVSQVHGVGVLLFHNTVYDHHQFPGWDAVYEEVLEKGTGPDVMAQTLSTTAEAWQTDIGLDCFGLRNLVLNK